MQNLPGFVSMYICSISSSQLPFFAPQIDRRVKPALRSPASTAGHTKAWCFLYNSNLSDLTWVRNMYRGILGANYWFDWRRWLSFMASLMPETYEFIRQSACYSFLCRSFKRDIMILLFRYRYRTLEALNRTETRKFWCYSHAIFWIFSNFHSGLNRSETRK